MQFALAYDHLRLSLNVFQKITARALYRFREAAYTRRRIVDLDYCLSVVRLRSFAVELVTHLRERLINSLLSARPFCAFLIFGMALLNTGHERRVLTSKIFITLLCFARVR